jgi:hypothetical protein
LTARADDLTVERRTLRLVIASSFVVAGFVAVFARQDRPRAVYLAAYLILGLALVTLGLRGGWRALPVFAVTYGVGCVIWQMFFWTNDPVLSGIDDIPPIAGFFVTAPFALVLVAAGWGGASFADGLRKRLDPS